LKGAGRDACMKEETIKVGREKGQEGMAIGRGGRAGRFACHGGANLLGGGKRVRGIERQHQGWGARTVQKSRGWM